MGEKKLLLGVDEVAEMLGVGERKAREVMLALAHVRIGKLLKIRPEVIDRWIKNGGDGVWRRNSSSEDESGGAGDTTSTASAGRSPRTSEIGERLNSLRVKSSGVTRLTPRTGHGRSSRLRKP